MNLDSLNPQQKAAVVSPEQYTLILAGAGSGKTRVLTSRIAWLIQTGQVTPVGVLAVTFTNKAAREMQARLSALLPINTRGMWIGTFHGLSNRLLRAHYRDAGLPRDFLILDVQDQLSAIKRLLKQQNIDKEKFQPKDIQRFINHHKENGRRPDDLSAYDTHEHLKIDLYRDYEKQCQREGVVDFPELLLRCYELLSRNEPLRKHYQTRFKHILIDEFQDTNDLQYRWLQLLAGKENSLFAVGDDDQSIYAFRGANVDNMLSFERDYARGKVIRLEQNYRSSAHILNAANALIKNNSTRLGKELWTSEGEGDPVSILELETERDEASRITDEIESLCIEESIPRSQIAILYRSNAQSRALEHALVSRSIPHRIYGGMRFYERREIKEIMAYLRLALDPRDDTSFLRVVNFPTRGIGAKTIENIAATANRIGSSMMESLGELDTRTQTKLKPFVQLIDSIRESAKSMTLPELIGFATRESGIREYYENDREGQDRIDNLEELVNAAQVFVIEENFEGCMALEEVTYNVDDGLGTVDTITPLSALVSHASLEAGDNQAQQDEEAVQLMTIHAAKGLEFDVVFLTGLEEGLFPHENSLMADGGLEEERRLMYVAITRARKRLYLSRAQARMLNGRSQYAMPSSFFDELPQDTLKWITPRVDITRNSYSNDFETDTRWVNPQVRQRARNRSTSATAGFGIEVNGQQFQVGQTVRHKRFGQGVILKLSGTSDDASANIYFSEAGEKTLALTVAKLEIVK